MIKIIDNFLDKDSFDAIGETSMMYSKVFWVGRDAPPENPYHDLVQKIFQAEVAPHSPFHYTGSSVQGATAWWNVRPIDPKPHSDLISYCTSNGVDYTPDDPPERTFIYYLRAPEGGGNLNIYTKPPIVDNMNLVKDTKFEENSSFIWHPHETDSIAPIPIRLISFPIERIHAVQPYVGNRVSIGMIFWNELPSIYKSPNDFGGQTNSNYNTSFDRPWEKDENQESNRKLTEDHIMGHPI